MTAIGIDKDGYRYWYNADGYLHRTDGPAIEAANGDRVWYINGELHRLDGPAVEDADGLREWWINDIEYSETKYNVKLKSMLI